jgi:hypothetical protein
MEAQGVNVLHQLLCLLMRGEDQRLMWLHTADALLEG